MTHSESPKPIPRPRRAVVEGAIWGGLAGYVLASLATTEEAFPTGASINSLGGAALGAVAPVPLGEALDKAANSLGLTLVSMRRTGAKTATALVEAGDGYHTVQCEARRGESREAIDDELYSGIVARMKSLACQT